MMKIIVVIVLILALLFSGYLHRNGATPEPVGEQTLSETVPEYLPAPSLKPAQTPKPTPEPDTRHWSEKEIAAPAVPMGGQSAPEGMVMLKDLPYYYRAADAIEDGCVVYYYDEAGSRQQSGGNVWDAFVKKAAAGERAIVRRVEDYTNDSYAAGDYTKTADIEFDGENYIVRRYFRDQNNGAEYEVLDTYRPITQWEKENDPLVRFYKDRAEAEADGCVIYRANEGLFSGEDKLNAFLAAVERGEKARVRIVNQSYSANDIYKVYQVEFDGEYFIYRTTYFNDLMRTSVYPYMLTFDVPSHGGTQYMLVQSDVYTWKELSAAWGAPISSADEGWLTNDRAFVIPIEENHEEVQP